MADIYVVNGNEKDPLAWPTYTTAEDLKGERRTLHFIVAIALRCTELAPLLGLPPHCLSLNELDPLRDEGLEHFSKLTHAGVDVCCRTVIGTPHCCDLALPNAIPEVYAATARDIKGFADRL